MGALPYSPAVVESSRVEVPLTGNALELLGATVLEVDAGAGGEVPDDAGDEYLARPGLGSDPRPNVDRDALDRIGHELHLPGVDARPDVKAKLADRVDRAMRAGDRARWAVEGGEEPV